MVSPPRHSPGHAVVARKVKFPSARSARPAHKCSGSRTMRMAVVASTSHVAGSALFIGFALNCPLTGPISCTLSRSDSDPYPCHTGPLCSARDLLLFSISPRIMHGTWAALPRLPSHVCLSLYYPYYASLYTTRLPLGPGPVSGYAVSPCPARADSEHRYPPGSCRLGILPGHIPARLGPTRIAGGSSPWADSDSSVQSRHCTSTIAAPTDAGPPHPRADACLSRSQCQW